MIKQIKKSLSLIILFSLVSLTACAPGKATLKEPKLEPGVEKVYLLSGFDNEEDLEVFNWGITGKMEFSKKHVTQGKHSLKFLFPEKGGKLDSYSVQEKVKTFPEDWASLGNCLCLDLYNEGDSPLELKMMFEGKGERPGNLSKVFQIPPREEYTLKTRFNEWHMGFTGKLGVYQFTLCTETGGTLYLDNLRIVTETSPPPPKIIPIYLEKGVKVEAQGPPILIEAEDFTKEGGGRGGAKAEICDKPGASKKALKGGCAFAGCWLEWQFDIPQDGEYKITVRYATTAASGTREVAIDGQTVKGLEAVVLPGTGGWSAWEEGVLPKTLSLKAGKHTLKMTNLSSERGINLDWIKVDLVGGAPAPHS